MDAHVPDRRAPYLGVRGRILHDSFRTDRSQGSSVVGPLANDAERKASSQSLKTSLLCPSAERS